MAKVKKSNAGRPTVITPEVTAKLLSAFSVGANIGESCRFAGISEDAFANARKSSPEFNGKMEAAQDQLILKAKNVLAKKIHGEDIHTTLWFLERKCRKEYATHQDIDLKSDGEKIGFNMVIKKTS
jgi:hypothetical protein